MSFGKVVAGCAGLFLLLPGLCFLGIGVYGGGKIVTEEIPFILTGVIILGGAGWLIYAALRPPTVEIKHPTEQEPSTGPEPPKTE